MVYAIIQTGGKQYRVEEGQVIKIEKLDNEVGSMVEFNQIMLVSTDNDLKVGNPVVKGAKVVGKVLDQGKDKKIVIFKYKSKKRYHKKNGHRQPYTRVLVEKIEA